MISSFQHWNEIIMKLTAFYVRATDKRAEFCNGIWVTSIFIRYLLLSPASYYLHSLKHVFVRSRNTIFNASIKAFREHRKSSDAMDHIYNATPAWCIFLSTFMWSVYALSFLPFSASSLDVAFLNAYSFIVLFDFFLTEGIPHSCSSVFS